MIPVSNPYDGVSFTNKVPSISHEHARNSSTAESVTASRVFNYLYRCGIRHFAFSNYYPSSPVYPLDDPYDTTVSLTNPTDPLSFQTIPEDAIGCPNAEHHEVLRFPSMHINGIGSMFASGKPWGQTPPGVNANWKYLFDHIIANFIYADGGGITINHPNWTTYYGHVLDVDSIKRMLDYDSRVLGIEIYNKTCENDVSQTGYSIDVWDAILVSGRQCYGFAVPDHDGENYSTTDTGTPPIRNANGRNVLLCEATEHECLKAYRNGHFYAQISNSSLAFTDIWFNPSTNTFTVETSGADSITIVMDETETEYSGNSVSIVVPEDSMYVRAEAHSANDAIYSNAIIFGQKQPIPDENGTYDEMMFLFD